MNYAFWWDGQSTNTDDIPIITIFREPWQRPSVGMELHIKGKHVRVTRAVPSSNPDNTAVTYYVEPVNGNWPYRQNK